MKKLLIPMLAVSVLAGCTNKDTMIPPPDQSMQQVYDRAMGSTSSGKLLDERSVLRRDMVEADTDYSEFVRTEATQLQSKFKLLPNPTMYMFVNAHLSLTSGVPIPAYLTEFKLHDRDHYALPGETMLSNGQ